MLDPRLNHVVAVAHSGSFTKAAEKVGVTQSGITKSIADLEREIGYAIFYRTSRGAMLTEDGRDFVDRASRLLDDAKLLLKGDLDRTDPYAGVLRIGVCPASLERLLADPLARLLSKHNSIRLEVIGGSFERVIQLLRNGSVDVAVGFEAAFAEWSDVRRERFAILKAKIFARKNHPILDRPTAKVADLSDYDFVVPSDSRPYGVVIREMYENRGIEWQKHLHVLDNFRIVRRIVATSDALSFTTEQYAATQAFRNQFAVIDGLQPFAPSPLCCAIRSRWEPKPAVRAFIRTMRESVALGEL